MSRTEPRATELAIGSAEVPDDVRAEMDADERRVKAEPVLGAPAAEVPEDVLSELDREARLGHQEILRRLAEGEPPSDEESDA
jgi:hypothetical protein